MMNPAQFYEAGRQRSGTALFPIVNSPYFSTLISTRLSNYEVDGVAVTSSKTIDFSVQFLFVKEFQKDFIPNFSGNVSVKFKSGLQDVYSLQLSAYNDSGTVYNIQDFEAFINQFPNIYSFVTRLRSNTSVIRGNIAKVPDSMERIRLNYLEISNASDFYLNLNEFSATSKLKYFFQENQSLLVNGDLSQLPQLVSYFRINSLLARSSITYTAGKVWASSFDTLYLPIVLTTTETDNILIDMNNSIYTAIGAKSITLQGYRSLTSDSAVAGLIAKGFVVNCKRQMLILDLPLSTNLLDTTTYANHATMVGTETHASSGLQTSTGNYAYIPNKTSLDIGTGSIAFGCKVKFNSVTSFFGIVGKTIAGSAVGRYGIFVESGLIYGLTQITSGIISNTISVTAYNDGNFHSIEVICNRTTGLQSLKIDGITVNTQSFTPSSDNLARNARFIMGAYGDVSGTGTVASSELNGIIKDVFVYKF